MLSPADTEWVPCRVGEDVKAMSSFQVAGLLERVSPQCEHFLTRGLELC